jgi:hypothetical protein
MLHLLHLGTILKVQKALNFPGIMASFPFFAFFLGSHLDFDYLLLVDTVRVDESALRKPFLSSGAAGTPEHRFEMGFTRLRVILEFNLYYVCYLMLVMLQSAKLWVDNYGL